MRTKMLKRQSHIPPVLVLEEVKRALEQRQSQVEEQTVKGE